LFKKWLLIGIILLFIFTSVSPMAFGSDSKLLHKDDYLNNLAFYCLDANDSNAKYEYYNDQMLKEHPDNDIDVVEDVVQPVELISATSSGGPMDSPWSMKCHDLHHTSRSPYSTANITGLEKWRFRASDGVDGGPIIGDDGTIYFGDKDRYIYAIYPNGTLKWKYHTSHWITSAPALAEDGTLYVGSWDCKLYAFNPDGSLKWKVGAHGGSIASSPAIAEDGTIYVGTMKGFDEGEIVAFNSNGTVKWVYPTGYYIISCPAIGDDGTIYIGSGDTYFYAMNPNGTLKWRFKTGDVVKAPPSIAVDGTIYIGSFDDYLYALYPNNGTMKWKCKVGYGTYTNPSIASDGTIYIGGQKLYAIYPNGTMKWSFDLGSEIHIAQSSSAISADGTIYVGTQIGSVSGGDIIAINPDGTEKWRKKLVDNEWIRSSPCIGEDGTVYIGSQREESGYLHAFGPVESNSPPETPTISGETNGEAGKGYWYAFNVIDPDLNPISFYIDWGDGTEGWKFERASGETCYYKHTWSEEDNYTIRVKAKDVLGEESDWGYLEVIMPKNKPFNFNFNLLSWLLERFPNAFPIMRQLLGL
jgi:outer membrane protein assembly factor BamB